MFEVTQAMLKSGHRQFVSPAINHGTSHTLFIQVNGEEKYPEIIAHDIIMAVIKCGACFQEKINSTFPEPNNFCFAEGGQYEFYYSDEQKTEMLKLYAEVYPHLPEALEKVRAVI